MRFVERVGGERFDGVPQSFDGLGREAVFFHPGFKGDKFLGQHFGFFLTHGFAESVCLSGGVVGHFLGNTHDLLLVHDQTVSFVENFPQWFFKFGVDGGDFFAAVFAVGVGPVRAHAHGPGAVQRESGHDVIEAGWFHAFQQLTHATGVQLEHAQGVAARKKFVGGHVLGFQGFQVQVNAAVGFDVFNAVADNGEVAQPQEVHFQQANGLTGGVRPAGDQRAVGRPLPHGDAVEQRHARHNHGTGVHAGLPNDALQPPRGFVNVTHIGVILNEPAHLTGFAIAFVFWVHDAGQRNIFGHDRRRQCLGNAIGDLVAGLPKERARGIFQRLFCFHRAKGDHLRDFILAPVVGSVANHFAAPTVVKVNINIGCGGAFRVEEPLKQQAVFNRVNVRDGQRIRHQSTGSGTTARPHANTNGACVLNQIRHDEEV